MCVCVCGGGGVGGFGGSWYKARDLEDCGIGSCVYLAGNQNTVFTGYIMYTFSIAYCNHRSKNLTASLPWYVPPDSEQCRNILDDHEECVQFKTESTS